MTNTLPQKLVSDLTFRKEGCHYFTEIKNVRTRRPASRFWWATAEEATAAAAKFNAEKTINELTAVAFEAKFIERSKPDIMHYNAIFLPPNR